MVTAVVGGFPLVQVVLWGCVIVVVVVDTLAKFPVTEPNSSRESSKVGELNIILLKESNDFLSIRVIFLQYLLFLNSWIVASV